MRWIYTALLVFAGGSSALLAADAYICDCATGASPSCVTGDDSNPGSMNLPWRTYESARLAFPALAAGDSLQFCRGGAWDIAGAGTRWINTNCEATNSCVVAAYVPSWGNASSPRPILRRLDGGHAFALEDGGNAEHEEGYHFADLDLRSTTYTSNGFFLYNDIDDVTVENVAISGFAIGVHLAGSNPCSADPECDGQNERLVIEGATIIDNEAQGFLGAASGLQILDSYFEGNGTTAVFDHNIYVSGSSGGLTVGIRLVGNRLYRSALDESGVCQAVSLVVHGEHSDLLIENNEVWEDIGMAGQGCWGIAVDPGYGGSAESFTDVIIRGNRVADVGNVAIGTASCSNCLIENNVIIQRNAFGMIGIAAPNRARGAQDAVQDNVVVRNNSIYIAASSGGTAIRVDTEGDEHQIVSNAVLYDGTGGSFNCLDADQPIANYTDIDANICHSPGAPNAEWADGFGSLPEWQTASGFDLESSAEDPGFADPLAGDLWANSMTAEMVDAGHPTLSSPTEIGGFPRDPDPDQGAYEWGVDGLFADGFESGNTTAWGTP